MTVRWSEAAAVLLTFLGLVALPLIAIQLVPAQTLDQLKVTGLDIQDFLMQTAVLGLIISVITLVKAIIRRTSIAYLVFSVSSDLISLAFALLVIGVGNVGSLGYSSFKFMQEKVVTEIVLDLRVFIWLSVGVVAISVLQSVVKFREMRSEITVSSAGKPAS
ncbi:MAG: hypothetical protein ABSA11_06865 [Candidatus Bathyarchaeia archaeon]